MTLLNYRWYRNLFSSRTYLKVDGQWIDKKNYVDGKITEVDGKWNNQAFCECGHELVHSNSFTLERRAESHNVMDSNCSYCGKLQHWNSDMFCILVPSNEDGVPL